MREFMERIRIFPAASESGAAIRRQPRTYPTEIDGTKMENYLAWMKSAYYISAVGNPAISVPCAFSETSLPIGLQIVGRHNDDGACSNRLRLRASHQTGKRRPPII